MKTKISFILLALVMISSCSTGPGKYDAFAQCVSDSGAKIYSAWWCPHCQDQKADFGKSYKILVETGAHVECSPGGIRYFSEFCTTTEGFKSTPTWFLGNGKILSGRQPLEVLSLETGCPLEEN